MKIPRGFKIIWTGLVAGFILGMAAGIDQLTTVGVLGVVMMSLWLDLAERIESNKQQQWSGWNEQVQS